MKKIIVALFFLLASFSLFAQPVFDVGLKAGINNSKVTVNAEEITPESIVKAHIGAFGRIGWSRLYLQPELYYISKGGELFSESSFLEKATTFDFNNVDVPLLVGVKVLKGEFANLRLMAGPVFSFLTSGDIDGDTRFDDEFFKSHYFSFQYGLGVDIKRFFIDARIEHGKNDVYNQSSPDIEGENRTFMITAGFKIF